jgi:regulatory protein
MNDSSPPRNREPGRQDPWPVALRILARQDRSCADLRQRLLKRGFEPDRIEPVLTRCQELGYLDDRRYAGQVARSLMTSGRAVGRRLEQELKKRGVDPETAAQAIETAAAAFSNKALISDLAARRYPGFDFHKAEEREKRRVIHFFLRRGFATGDILQALKAEKD